MQMRIFLLNRLALSGSLSLSCDAGIVQLTLEN